MTKSQASSNPAETSGLVISHAQFFTTAPIKILVSLEMTSQMFSV